MGYSIDFRKRVIETREKKKLSIKETSKLFGVASSTIQRWLERIEPCTTRNKPATKIDMEALKADVEMYPDAYQWERAGRLGVSESCVQFALKRLGVSYKKNASSSKGERRRSATLCTED
jgi:transposase